MHYFQERSLLDLPSDCSVGTVAAKESLNIVSAFPLEGSYFSICLFRGRFKWSSCTKEVHWTFQETKWVFPGKPLSTVFESTWNVTNGPSRYPLRFFEAFSVVRVPSRGNSLPLRLLRIWSSNRKGTLIVLFSSFVPNSIKNYFISHSRLKRNLRLCRSRSTQTWGQAVTGFLLRIQWPWMLMFRRKVPVLKCITIISAWTLKTALGSGPIDYVALAWVFEHICPVWMNHRSALLCSTESHFMRSTKRCVIPCSPELCFSLFRSWE